MIPEGVLYTIDTTTATIIDTRRFTPTCRERDIALTNTASHKGFSHEDKELDRTTFCHKIAPTPQTSNWVKGATWPKAATATHRVPFKPPNLRSESEPLDDHWLDGDFEPMMEDAYGSAGIDIEKFEQFCNANPDIGDSLYTYVTDELLDGDPVKALKIVEDAYRKEQKGQLATI